MIRSTKVPSLRLDQAIVHLRTRSVGDRFTELDMYALSLVLESASIISTARQAKYRKPKESIHHETNREENI